MALLKLLAPLALIFTLQGPAQSDPPTTPEEADTKPSCNAGALKQGGLLLCRGEAGSFVTLNGVKMAQFDEQGRAVIGLRTNTAATIKVGLTQNGQPFTETLSIAPRHDETSRIYPQDCDKVSPRTKEQIDHIVRSSEKEKTAFAKFNDGDGLYNGVLRPVSQPSSSPFNKLREYVCKSKDTGETITKPGSPHGGHDFATPTGTPIASPAAGVVILADPDLYFEGGSVFVDHGMGLVSIFMHMSALDVKTGDVVKTGDILGKTGNTGRTTGPHLHWSVKWRNTLNEDRGGDFYIDPALIMDHLVLVAD